MTGAPERRRRRAESVRRRRRRRAAIALVVVALAAGGGVAAATSQGGKHDPAPAKRAAAAPRKVSRPLRVPPRPIPGYLLIADRGNDRVLLVDGKKRILWRYPRGAGAGYPFRFDDDAFFGPTFHTIISNQEDQHTLQVISFPGGRLLWRYGHANVRGSAPGYLNTPDDAYLLPNGLRSVADAYNCRVLLISRAGAVVHQYGRTLGCTHDPPRSFGAVNGATPVPGGGFLVSEIQGSWIDRITAGGRLLWSFRAPVSYPSDPQWLGPDRILLADYARPGHALIVDTRGRVLWRYGPSAGPWMLDHPSLALPLRNGLIAINDDYRDRVLLVSLATHRVVWQYGHTDVKGTGPGYLNTPDGMDLLPTARLRDVPAIRSLVAHAAKPAAR